MDNEVIRALEELVSITELWGPLEPLAKGPMPCLGQGEPVQMQREQLKTKCFGPGI